MTKKEKIEEVMGEIMRLSEVIMMLCGRSPLDEAGDMTAVSMTLALMGVSTGMSKAEALEAFGAIFDVVAERYKAEMRS
jgi:hypothetical protein